MNRQTWSGLLLAGGGELPATHAARQTFSNCIAWLKETTGHDILCVDVASLLGETRPAEHMLIVAIIQNVVRQNGQCRWPLSEVYLSAVPLDIRVR